MIQKKPADDGIIPPQPITGVEFLTLIVSYGRVLVRFVPTGVQMECNCYDNYSLLS